MKFKYLAGLAAAIVFFIGRAGATSIAVPNNSFENPALGASEWTSGACPSGWDCSGSPGFYGGVYYPTNAQFSPGTNGISGVVPDGNNVAYVYGLVPQQLAQYTGLGSITSNTTYTLGVWAGARGDQGPDAWTQGFTASIQLLANGVVVASQAVPDPGLGNWENITVSLDSSNFQSNVGDYLGIRLVWTSTGASTYSQVAWDDITLNSMADTGSPGATPLPGSIWLLGSVLAGSAGAACWRRKRQSARLSTSSI